MSRTKKATRPELDPGVIDLDAIYDMLIDLQVELLTERNAFDFGGHDYGYKVGYATSMVNIMLALMEGHSLGDAL